MDELIIVKLTPRQVKQYILMQFLDSVGVFDVKLGRVILDFTKEGTIGNVSITHNYKPTNEKFDKVVRGEV